jgi:uncharacterized membrane protein YfcA
VSSDDKELQQELHKEFLKSLHEEKIKTQGERATYITGKLAFVTGLFGLGSLKIGGMDFHWLLYLIPLVAIGYDLYIRAADSSIKKIGAFLRSHPQAKTAESEKAWEHFSAQYRDKLALLATTMFTAVVTVAAAVYIYVQESVKNSAFWIGFIAWLVVCLTATGGLWASHRSSVKKIDEYGTEKA